MIQLIAQIIYNVFIFLIWPFQLIFNELFLGKRKKQKRDLALLISQIDHRLVWDRDLLNANQTNQLQELKSKAIDIDKEDEPSLTKFISKSTNQLHKLLPHSKTHFMKESLELLVVVFGVVMGARALFLQPFKIPTGSMQPTLFGIHFNNHDTAEDPNIFERVFDYANYSCRYTNIVIEENGSLRWIKRKNPFYFFPYCVIKIGNKTYNVPGEQANVERYISKYRRDHYPLEDPTYFTKGQTLIKGNLELGDHLFVDRVRFNFTDPQHGDITVFITDGIQDVNGKSLRGRYYIKRLVGLPGDTIRITDRKLYVKQKNESEFKLVDNSIHPAFERIYSFKGGYRGYAHSFSQYLTHNNDYYILKEDQYFMLGDNSENSQDSRYWGVVPRKNIVGRANIVYWPFSRRWGFTDKAEPENFDSPPSKRNRIVH